MYMTDSGRFWLFDKACVLMLHDLRYLLRENFAMYSF
jgi:hypothetical protein